MASSGEDNHLADQSQSLINDGMHSRIYGSKRDGIKSNTSGDEDTQSADQEQGAAVVLRRLSTKAPPKPPNPVNIPGNNWTKRSLRPWTNFPKLYGERKFAQRFTEKPFRFLDLPYDIRRKIYDLVLIHQEPIDFHPRMCVDPKSNNKGNPRRFAPRTVWTRQHQVFHRKASPKLMRVCQFVYWETAPVFYGQNTFRFTHFWGMDVLNAFLRTIGNNKTFVKSIAVEAPGLQNPPMRSQSQAENLIGWCYSMKLRNPSPQYHEQRQLKVLSTLQFKMPSLAVVDFLLPSEDSIEFPAWAGGSMDDIGRFAAEPGMQRVKSLIQARSDVAFSLVALPGYDVTSRELHERREQQERSRDIHPYRHHARRELCMVTYKGMGLPIYEAIEGDMGVYEVDRSKSIVPWVHNEMGIVLYNPNLKGWGNYLDELDLLD